MYEYIYLFNEYEEYFAKFLQLILISPFIYYQNRLKTSMKFCLDLPYISL